MNYVNVHLFHPYFAFTHEGNPGSRDVFVDTGAVIKCQSLTAYLEDGSNVFMNGTVTCTRSFDILNVRVVSGNLHVSVDGILGEKLDTSNDKDIKKMCKKKNQHTDSLRHQTKTPPNRMEQDNEIDTSCELDAKTESSGEQNTKTRTNKLYLEIINGDLTNFGLICAKEYLLLICDTLTRCEDSEFDTASRGFRSYTALQKESGYLPNVSVQENPKQCSSLYDARLLSTVQRLDSESLISILNEEVDPTVKVDERSIYDELNNICKQGNRATYDKDKVEKELIRGSLNTWKWKHGVISSTSIKCIVKQDINDCSQLQSNELALEVGGTARVVKPWTWKCGELSGFVKGDFLFYDNAEFTKFNKLCVVSNLRIFRTSAIRVLEGGELTTGQEFENNSVLISEKSLILAIGYMKQARDSSIISNEDLLVALYEKFEDIWFGKIYADRHLFLQVQERVVCDAHCVAKDVHLEFFGECPQFVVTQDLLALEGSLNMWAEKEDEHENANFLLSGKLNSHGIQAQTASVCILPGGVVELTCETDISEVDVITRWLDINKRAVMISQSKQNKESEIIENSSLTTNVYCQESLVVDGVLGAFGSDLSIYCEALNNNGVIKLSTLDRSSSSLHIECDEEVFNSGAIESEGNMTIVAMIVSNETGVIKSSPSLRISTNSSGATSLCGQVLVDQQLFIHSESEEELMLNVTGGKSEEDRRHFIPPDQLEVKCKKGRLKIDSSIICPEINPQPSNKNEISTIILSLYKCLYLTRECELEDVQVQFIQIEQDNNNAKEPSKFVIQDAFKAKSLYLCSENTLDTDVTRKGNISFAGSNKATVVHSLEVDGSIHEVIFETENLFVCAEAVLDCELTTIKTDLECVEVDANNLNVHGQMRCIGGDTEEHQSLVRVKNTSSVDGSVVCVGSVEIVIGESFVQAESGNIAVEGELLLKINNEKGQISLEGSTKGKKESVMKVVSDNIRFSGCLSEVHTLSLNAESDMAFSEKSRISCEEISLKGEWITTAGKIDGFNTLSIEPWAILNSGIIDSQNDSSNVIFQSDLTLINSGICRAQMTYLEAPFLLSLPGEVISDVNDVTHCQLVGKEQLKLESIACFLGGSSLLSCKRYENLSVLLFKFLTYVACTPDSKSLEAWSKAAESLRNIQSETTSKQDSTKLKTLMNSKELVTGTEVDLRIARMYDMVNDFVAEILKNGIKSFDTTKLVHILTIESERYTKINILKEILLKIPDKARAIRKLAKKGKIKLMKSVRKRFGLSDPKLQSQRQDGIFESGFYSFGEGVTFTDFLYEAAFAEVFCDEGFLFAADFLASAKDVVLSKREKKAVAMIIYSENLNMENIDVEHAQVAADKAKLKNMKTKTLDVNVRESVEANKITSDELQLQGGKELKATDVCAKNAVMTATDIKLKDIKSTNLDVQASKAVDITDVQGSNVHVQAKDISAAHVDASNVDLNATNSASLKNITSDDLNVKSGQSIIAENIKGDSVHMESGNINVSSLDAKNTGLNAANKAHLTNIQSHYLQVQAEKTIDAKNIKGNSVHMKSGTVKASNVRSEVAVLSGEQDVQVGDIKSKTALFKSSQGAVKATGKIEAKNAEIESKNGINLAYNKNGSLAADHQFGSLQMKTNKINEVNELLKGGGIYKELKISDGLGLAVSDQDIIFSRCVVQQNYKLNLKAKSVNIDNASLNWSKGASITSDRTMNVNDSSLTSQESISLKSTSGNINMNLSQVEAGVVAKVEANKGSVSLTGASISGDQAAIVKAKEDVIIDAVVESHSTSSRRSGFFSSSRNSSSYSTVTKSGISSAKGIVAVEAEEGKVQATAAEFAAEKGVHISAAKDIIIRDKITIREEVSVKKNWFRKKRTVRRTEESHKSLISSRGPVCMKSKRDIRITGTDCIVQDDMFLEAAGTVLLQDRILSTSEQRHTSGFTISQEKGLSCGESNKQLHQQQLAGSKLQVGGNLVMKGKNVFVKNALEMNATNLLVDAENVKFEGAELNNSYSERNSSVNFGIMSFDITEEEGWGKEKKMINQNINVRGQTNFKNCKNATLAASNLNTGAISGYVENLSVISRQTEIEAKKKTKSVGFVVSGCLPVPSKYGESESCDKGKFIEKSSGIHVRGSINKNEFKVGTIHLKGSSVTANGDIAKFAENIISEKVNSYRSQTASGFNFGISKTSVEFGIHQSEKFMAMEHNATIGSFSGTVANEVKQSVNTDLSKHSQITQMRNSNLGFNVKAGKEGYAASVQIDDIGVGFSASKQEIGFHGQVGDKGFSVSGGQSGASLSLQNGEDSLGVGVTNQGIDVNIRSGDTAIGASLGKNALSATVQSKDVSLGASTTNGSTSVQTKIGDFQSGITRNKNLETGERSTSAHISKGEFGISAATSKHSKSFALKGGDYGFGLQKSKGTSAEKSKYSGNIKARDIEIEASTSKCQKTFGLTAGEYHTTLNKETDTKTRKSKYDGNVKLGDAKLEASYSKDKKSFGLETPEFQTKLNKETDSKTRKSKYDGHVKIGDAKLEGSYSKDKQSFGLETPEFQTKLNKETDSKTRKSKYDGHVKIGDAKLEGSYSKDKQSFGLETPEFQTKLNKETDSKTRKSKYDGHVKIGDAKLEGSYSKDKQSFGLETPEFQTKLNKETDSKTRKSKYDGHVKIGDAKLEGSYSKDKQSFGLETPEFQTKLNKETDSKTRKSKYDGHVKIGDAKLDGSYSKDKQSFGLETPEFQTKLNKETDSKTRKSKYDGHVKIGDAKLEGSYSKDKQSFGLETPEFQTKLNKETDSKTRKSKYDGHVKIGDAKLEGSYSKDKQSFGLETPEFQTKLNKETDSKTRKSKYDGHVKIGDAKLEGSYSKDKQSFGLETPEFQTKLNKETDSKTRKSKYDGHVKIGDAKLEGSYSKDKQSFGLETPEFQTKLNKEKDSKTRKSKYDGHVKIGDAKFEGSYSKDKQSFGLETPEFQTKLNKETDSKTRKSKYDGHVKIGDAKLEGSYSKDKKSFGLKAGEFETEFNKGKDSITGKSKHDAKIKVGELEMDASSSKEKKTFGLKAGEFQTVLNKERDSITGKSKHDAKIQVGELEMDASLSKDKKTFGLKAEEFQTELNKERDSITGKSKHDAKIKVGELEMDASSSKDKKTFGLKAGEFQTELNKERDSITGKSKHDAKIKVGELEMEASSSKDKKTFGLKAGEFQTVLNKERDSITGKSKHDAKIQVGELEMDASLSKDKKTFGLKAGEFQTELNKERDSITGKSKHDAKTKVGELEMDASSSKDKKTFGLKAGESQTELNKETDSITGKSKHDAKIKVGELEMEASSSKDKKTFGLKAGEFQTELNKERDSITGKSKHDAKIKVGEVEMDASSSKDKKTFGLKAGDFQTELNKETDSITGKSKHDAKIKVGEVEMDASSSKDKKTFGLKAEEFQTELNKERDSITGKSKRDAEIKVGELEMEASSSKDKKTFGLKAGDFETELNKEKDSTMGKSKHDAKIKVGELKMEASSSKDKKTFGLKAGEFETELNKEKDSTIPTCSDTESDGMVCVSVQSFE